VTVYGYSRVSTTEQPHGIDAQQASIDREAVQRGWDVVHVTDAGWSGSNLDRPGVGALLAQVKRGDVIVVARLDRLSRSLADFAALMEQAKRRRWSFVALDLGVDTTTATGRLVANVMASVAEWERAVIGPRTKDALAARGRGDVAGHRSQAERRPAADRDRWPVDALVGVRRAPVGPDGTRCPGGGGGVVTDWQLVPQVHSTPRFSPSTLSRREATGRRSPSSTRPT
jgi:DNA invertase Pin-like site-specific DNA recombinase